MLSTALVVVRDSSVRFPKLLRPAAGEMQPECELDP